MPGPHRRRLSKEQSAEAVELAQTMLVRREHKATIKKALRTLLGPTSARTLERLLARARDLILDNIGRGKLMMRSLSLAGYEAVITDPAASARDRLFALTRIDKLMGLEDRPNLLAPLEVLLSFFPAALAEQVRQALREHMQAPTPSGNGHVPPPPPEPPPPPPTTSRSRIPLDPDLPPLL
jgi:hypothetical protein